MTDTTTETMDLETQLCAAVHDPDADVEQLAHAVASSDRAQVYLVELMRTLGAIAPTSPAIGRAEALLEHGLAVASHLAVAAPDPERAKEREGERG